MSVQQYILLEWRIPWMPIEQTHLYIRTCNEVHIIRVNQMRFKMIQAIVTWYELNTTSPYLDVECHLLITLDCVTKMKTGVRLVSQNIKSTLCQANEMEEKRLSYMRHALSVRADAYLHVRDRCIFRVSDIDGRHYLFKTLVHVTERQNSM